MCRNTYYKYKRELKEEISNTSVNYVIRKYKKWMEKIAMIIKKEYKIEVMCEELKATIEEACNKNNSFCIWLIEFVWL